VTKKPAKPADPHAPTLPSMGAVKAPSSSGEHEAVRQMHEELRKADELDELIRSGGQLPSSQPPAGDGDGPITVRPRQLEEEAKTARDERVLVVDDEVEIAKMIAERLREIGYKVRIAHDGIEALRKALVEVPPPDAIILDVGLPYLSGDGVRAALDTTYLAGIPILWISAGDRTGVKPDRQRDFVFVRKGSKLLPEIEQYARELGIRIGEWRAMPRPR
jgi:CheY-like chemotaxis protein